MGRDVVRKVFFYDSHCIHCNAKGMDVCKGVVFSQRYLYDLSKLSITSKLQCKKWDVISSIVIGLSMVSELPNS